MQSLSNTSGSTLCKRLLWITVRFVDLFQVFRFVARKKNKTTRCEVCLIYSELFHRLEHSQSKQPFRGIGGNSKLSCFHPPTSPFFHESIINSGVGVVDSGKHWMKDKKLIQDFSDLLIRWITAITSSHIYKIQRWARFEFFEIETEPKPKEIWGPLNRTEPMPNCIRAS
jgi:hypothetical protein